MNDGQERAALRLPTQQEVIFDSMVEGLLLLDATVSISSLKPVRDEEGRLTLQRAYDFEYSDTGNNRLKGSVVLVAHRVVLLNVGVASPARAVRTLH